MPTRDWKMMRYRTPWYQGDTVPIGIGQGYWTSTPLQLAKATSVLVNHGKVMPPHILRATLEHGEDFSTQQLVEPEPMPSITEVPDRIWDVPLNAMRLVNHGSRVVADVHSKGKLDYTSGGKSGTAQVFDLAKDQVYNSKKLARHLLDHALIPRLHLMITLNTLRQWLLNTVTVVQKLVRHIRKVLDYAFEHKSGVSKDHS